MAELDIDSLVSDAISKDNAEESTISNIVDETLGNEERTNEAIKSFGVDPQSKTLIEDLRNAGLPKSIGKNILINMGFQAKRRYKGVEQLVVDLNQMLGLLTSGKVLPEDNVFDADILTKEFAEEEEAFLQSPAGSSIVGQLGRGATDLALMVGTPIKGGNVITQPLKGMAVGGGFGASEFSGEPDRAKRLIEKIESTSTGMALGATIPLALRAGTGAANVTRGTGLASRPEEIADAHRRFSKFKKLLNKEGKTIPAMMAHQAAPENMVLGRLGMQAESTSKFAQHRIIEQQSQALKAGRSGIPAKITEYKAGKVLLSEGDKAYKSELNKVMAKMPKRLRFGRDVRSAGRALQKGIADDFITKSKAEVSSAYNKASDAANTESPIFNLGIAKAKAQVIREGILAENAAMTAEGLAVNPQNAKLVKLVRDIEDAANKQTNYEALKQLRTRAGDIIENWPWSENYNAGQAKALYGALTETMINPANKAPKFVRAAVEASAKAKARFDMLSVPTIQRIIRTDAPEKIAKTFATGTMPEELMFTMSRYAPDKANRLRGFILNERMFGSEAAKTGALNTLKNWRAVDPKGYAFMTRGGENELLKVAKNLDKLNTSMSAQLHTAVMAQKTSKEGLRLLMENSKVSERDFTKFIGDVGGKGSVGHTTFRSSVYEMAIEDSVTHGKLGTRTLDPKKLDDVITKFKKSGLWNVLEKPDKTRLEGLQGYLMLTMSRGKDPGASLEAAQAITQLKSPFTFIQGAHKLGVNELSARVLASKTFGHIYIGKGVPRWKLPDSLITKSGAIVDALMENLSEGFTLGKLPPEKPEEK